MRVMVVYLFLSWISKRDQDFLLSQLIYEKKRELSFNRKYKAPDGFRGHFSRSEMVNCQPFIGIMNIVVPIVLIEE